MADQAAVERQQQAVRRLRQALGSELDGGSDEVEQVRARASELARQHGDGDVETVVAATLDEIFGLGPLEPLLGDPDVRSIRLVGAALWADGEPVPWGFHDDAHARAVVERILAAVGEGLGEAAHVSERQAVMLDGSTVRARVDEGVVRAWIERSTIRS